MNTRKPISTRLNLALLALSAATVTGSVTLGRAQPQPGVAPAAKAAAPKDREPGAVRIVNPGGEATLDMGRNVRHAERNVQLWQEGEDFILYADDVTHYGNDNNGIGVARGNLHVESRDSTIIGDLLRADFTEKVMTLTGNVVLKSHGEKDGLRGKGDGKTVRGEVLHKPSSLTCDRLDYDYETKQATLSGNLRMRQGENFGTCERILFDEARNIVRMIGNVKFVNGERQKFEVSELTIWIDKNIMRSPGISTTIPGRPSKGNNAGRASRQPQDFGAEPVMPPDVLNGANAKPPPPLAPLGGKAAPATPAASATAPRASTSTPASEAKPADKPADKAAASVAPAPKSG